MLRQPHPLTRQPIKIRRANQLLSERTQFAITEIVRKYKNNVGPNRLAASLSAKPQYGETDQQGARKVNAHALFTRR